MLEEMTVRHISGVPSFDRLWEGFRESRRWLFEEPTQSQISTSILKYTTIDNLVRGGGAQRGERGGGRRLGLRVGMTVRTTVGP